MPYLKGSQLGVWADVEVSVNQPCSSFVLAFSSKEGGLNVTVEKCRT